ncbi:type II secretion system F family protein [Alteromonas halophila]|uniref:Type II secretion system protein F n=1 Tax=Alteromonas halophila TaxID=516698 RepID=A0A918JQD5_9ALTE|nr:type II secretion system F family protein [Alteromonas halophila]GGW92462.1 type II secretion system protein F [Alteromonas halophila]
MKFSYEGIDLTTEKSVSGEIDATSENEALRTLQSRKIEATKIHEVKERTGGKRKVTTSDLVLPLQELATLTESGVVLVEAVSALARNKSHPGLADGFRKIASLIESGENFSSAIKQSTLPFPVYVHHLVSAGEASGQLAVALRKASEQLNYDQAVKNDLRNALTYPLVLIGSGIAAMMIIFFAVVPKFSHMLDDDKPLPTLAWLVLSAGRAANDNPVMVLGGTAVVFLLVIAAFANPTMRSKVMNVAIELPVIGPWLAEQDAARWASLCGAMLTARVSLVTALTLSAESCGFTRRRQKAMGLITDVQSGVSLTDALERASLLPGTSLNLLAVGDKTGQLANMLNAVARLHDEASKRKMKQVMTLIEPIAILIVGILIGIMILGIVLAITASTDIAI